MNFQKSASILAVIAFTGSLTGCAGSFKTNAVPESAAVTVPSDRYLAYKTPQEGYAQVILIRDTGFLGGGCYMGVEINKKLAARFDTGEAATFYVPPGIVELATMVDPQGQGLCGPSPLSYSPHWQKFDISASKRSVFRLSSRQYRRPEFEPLTEGVQPLDEN